jgi:hypothetical protein
MMAVKRKPQERVVARTYLLEGTVLEACSCAVVCPCWVGEDPDAGACDAVYAYHVDRGSVRGTDVSGLNYVQVVQIRGNLQTPGSWRRLTFVDDRATPEQSQALLDVWRGRLGGPLADLDALVAEDAGVYQVAIHYGLSRGRGTLAIADRPRATISPIKSPFGISTTLQDTLFSAPRTPACVGKASEHIVSIPEHGMSWSFDDRNTIQGEFRYEF